MNPRWQEYYQHTKNLTPTTSLVDSLSLLQEKNIALDLGAGSLRDSRFLIDEGFKKVIAVDKETIPFEIVNELSLNNFKLIHSSFEQFNFSQFSYNLINAQYCLLFMNKGDFLKVWQKIFLALSQDGVFIGNLCGIGDEWAANKNMTFLSYAEILELCKLYKIIKMEEIKLTKKLANGTPKRWHLFEFVLRKIVN